MSKHVPKVSICIPAYNNVHYLKKTLASVIDQSYTNYEVIITDDSDNDAVKELTDRFNFDGKLRYYKNKSALGSPSNWNYCIDKAHGKYIKIMHHDDWFAVPDALAKLVRLLEADPDNHFAFCGSSNISKTGSVIYKHAVSTRQASVIKTTPEFLLYHNVIGSPSVTLIKKNSLRFDERLRYVVDMLYYINLLKLNAKFSFTTEHLVNIGIGDTQVTQSSVNNKGLLIFEYSYAYQNLQHDTRQLRFYVDTFWLLIRRFDIRTEKELIDSGWYGPVPVFIDYCIQGNRWIDRLYKKHLLQQIIKNIVFWYALRNDSYKTTGRFR